MAVANIPSFFGKNVSRATMKIVFEENIRVTTGYYLYSGLSLLAEIGGFIGLGQLFVWAYEKTIQIARGLKAKVLQNDIGKII